MSKIRTISIAAFLMLMLSIVTAGNQSINSNDKPRTGEVDIGSYNEPIYLSVTNIDNLYYYMLVSFSNTEYFNIPIYIEVRDRYMKLLNSNITVDIYGYYNCDINGYCVDKLLYHNYRTNISNLKVGFAMPYNTMYYSGYKYINVAVQARKYKSTISRAWYSKYAEINLEASTAGK